jgi:hypothetical protein
MKMSQNETASNRRPNIFGLPGHFGKNSPFQGYPDVRPQAMTSSNYYITKLN